MNNIVKDIISAILVLSGLVSGVISLIQFIQGDKTKDKSNEKEALGSSKKKKIVRLFLSLIAIVVGIIGHIITFDLVETSHTTDEYYMHPSYAICAEGNAVRAVFPSTGEYALDKITLSNKNTQDASIHSISVAVDQYDDINLPFFKFDKKGTSNDIAYMYLGSVDKKTGTYRLVYNKQTNNDNSTTGPVIIPGNRNNDLIPYISFQSPGLYTIHYIINYSVCGQEKQLVLSQQTIYVPNAEEIHPICLSGIDTNNWYTATDIEYSEFEDSITNKAQLKEESLNKLLDKKYINDVFDQLMPPPPNPPEAGSTTDLSIVAEKLSYHLSWTKTDEAKEYIVKRSVNKESFTELSRTSDLEYIDEDVSYGNEYWYVIDTVLSNGDIVTSNMGVMYSPDEIPEFPKSDWARIERILTSTEKVHLFVMPIDDPKYMLQNGLTTDANLDNHYVKAFFPENEFLLVELPMRKKDKEAEKNKQIIYIKEKAFDINPTFPPIPKPANIKGIIIADNSTQYFGPSNEYIKDTNHKVSKGTEITILYKQGDYYYAQYTISDHDVRMWLKQTDVKVYINQN